MRTHHKLVPTHMRHLKALSIFPGPRGNFDHAARQPAESIRNAVLMTASGHELHAHTDPQNRLSAPNYLLLQRLAQARDRFKAAHAISKSANARQHDPIGRRQVVRIGSHPHLGRMLSPNCGPGKSLCSGSKIAGTIVDDCDAHDLINPRI